VQQLLNSYDRESLVDELESTKGKLDIIVDGKAVQLVEGKHFWRDARTKFTN